MNLTLTRKRFGKDGVMGELADEAGKLTLETLEHAYAGPQGWTPKLPVGAFLCVRGIHRLHNLVDFETFEITGVVGHVDILFHVGNFNLDSEGCVLLGMAAGDTSICNSKEAFAKFMRLQEGVDQFTLTVKNDPV